MGYHVSIDESSQAMIRTLASEPNKVFAKLYSAYLLFLVTQHDRQQLDWVVSNAPGIDSLTGQYLAYAIFAKNFPVKIRTDATRALAEAELANRHEQLLEGIPPELLKRSTEITRLVENGSFGVVLDGDELTAITYGSDIVARELGVLDRLPCLVVLDAIPAKSPLVVPLTPTLLPELFQHLRGALSRFYAVGGHTSIRKDAERVRDLQSRLEAEHTRDATLRRRIAEEKEKLTKLRQKAESGVPTKDPNFFADLVVSRESALASLERELIAFPNENPIKLAELEAELAGELSRHDQHRDRTFSECLSAELRSAGFMENVAAAKAQSMTFLSSIFKPETLIKIWQFVH